MLGFWQSKAWSLILKYHSRQEGTKPQLLRYFVKLSLTLHHLLRRSLHSHQLHVYQLPSWGMCASLCQLWFTSYSVATVWYCCHNLSCWTAPSPPHDHIIFMCHPQITLLWRWGWSNNLWCATILWSLKPIFEHQNSNFESLLVVMVLVTHPGFPELLKKMILVSTLLHTMWYKSTFLLRVVGTDIF